MIIDTHTHLLDESFQNDRALVIERAAAENIVMLESALNEKEWQLSVDLARRYKNIRFSAGFHPHDASVVSDDMLSSLENFCAKNEVIGIGETGLDYYWKNSPAEKQEQLFVKQIELSWKLNKPLIVHCRDAYDDCIHILNSLSKKYRGVIHCFSGNAAYATAFIELGFLIGIDGPITYPNAANLREVIKELPLEKILVETDSPYLPPQRYRGKRNEPIYIKCILEALSSIKKLTYEEICETTTSNAKALFQL